MRCSHVFISDGAEAGRTTVEEEEGRDSIAVDIAEVRVAGEMEVNVVADARGWKWG